MISVLCGDALTTLKTLPSESVQCVVTSPPYYGLRDYGVEGQLGLEETHDLYVEKLVSIFREVKRVLRNDGTCWLNLGDSFYEKQLIGIPWKVAFALQEDGWWLRQDIIWSKDNPMPESVTDRCTKSHEYVFLLTKSARYFYDAEAVKEPQTRKGGPPERKVWRESGKGVPVGSTIDGRTVGSPVDGKRTKRSVWTIATTPYPGSHFATMPRKLAETCILAGTSEAGCCSECGKPLERVVDSQRVMRHELPKDDPNYRPGRYSVKSNGQDDYAKGGGQAFRYSHTLGFLPACACNAPSQSCTVLDPFSGSGTTGESAQRLGRNAILIELNPDYLPLIYKRTRQDALALCV